MKERDYIDVSDLTKLRNAKNILADITVANQPVISEDSYASVLQAISIWQMKLEKKIGALDEDVDTKSEVIIVRVDKKMREGLKKLANSNLMSISEYIRFLMDNAIKEKKRV